MPDAFLACLLGILFVAIWLRESCMTVTAAILLANWTLCVLLATVEGPGFGGLNAFSMGAIDFCSAMLVVILHERRWQLWVALIFPVMIGCHVLRLWWPSAFTPHVYLLALSWLAWTQLAITGGRGGYVVLRHLQRRGAGGGRVRPAGLPRDADADR